MHFKNVGIENCLNFLATILVNQLMVVTKAKVNDIALKGYLDKDPLK